MRATIVARRDRLKAVLACRIPDLQLNRLSVNLDGADLEIDADGRHEVLVEDVVGKTQQERGLADTRVTNK